MTLQLDQYGAVNCPYCGNSSTHQGGVQIFSRESENFRDAGFESTVESFGNTSRMPTENPSYRRDGVRIAVACESSPEEHLWFLNIYQHKGSTFVEQELS